MTPRELIDWTLRNSGWGIWAELEAKRWIDRQPDFDTSHYVNGFAWPDGKFRLKADWSNVPFRTPIRSADRCHAQPPRPLGGDRGGGCGASVPAGDLAGARLPQLQLHRDAELAGERRPPTVMIHPDDAATVGIADGVTVVLGNMRGQVRLHARHFEGVCRGVLIAESVWPNAAYDDGRGINTLTGWTRSRRSAAPPSTTTRWIRPVAA